MFTASTTVSTPKTGKLSASTTVSTLSADNNMRVAMTLAIPRVHVNMIMIAVSVTSNSSLNKTAHIKVVASVTVFVVGHS